MDTTAAAVEAVGVSEQAGEIVSPEIATATPAAELPKSNLQPEKVAAVDAFDEAQLANELFKVDLTQSDDYRRVQSAYDRQISELKRELEAVRNGQIQSAEERKQRALEALQNDPEALAQYWKAQHDAVLEQRREEKLRAEYEAEQAKRQAQTLKALAEEANELVKNANLSWDSPFMKAFNRKYPTPSQEAVRALGRALLQYQNTKLAGLQKQAPSIARDARIEALRESGAVKTTGSTGGTDTVIGIASQMRKALVSNDIETYRQLKQKLESLS